MRSDPRPGRGGLGPGPFVGRHAELARLRRGVELALGGISTCAWIVGEAGSGKTRLARELASYARLRGAGVRWLGPLGSGGIGARSLPASGPVSAELLVVDGVEAAGEPGVERMIAGAGANRLLLGTSRRPPTGALAAILGESVDLLVLDGLDPDALGRLLGALSGECLDAADVAAAVRATEGNPARARAWLTWRCSPVEGPCG